VELVLEGRILPDALVFVELLDRTKRAYWAMQARPMTASHEATTRSGMRSS